MPALLYAPAITRATCRIHRRPPLPLPPPPPTDSGASLALLAAGFNIDCLLTKYEGLDWWNQRTWECNARCGNCWPPQASAPPRAARAASLAVGRWAPAAPRCPAAAVH